MPRRARIALQAQSSKQRIVARKEGTHLHTDDCVIDLKKKHRRHLEVRINPDIIIKRKRLLRVLLSAPSLDASAWAALDQLWFVLRSMCFDRPGKASHWAMHGAKEVFCTFETRSTHLGTFYRTLLQPYAIEAARDPTLFVLRKGGLHGCMRCVSLA